MIYLASDFHFFHDREFIWKVRGFNSEMHMRNKYVTEWINTVKDNDDVYVVGDFCLGNDYEAITELITSLPGRIHLIIGNHDTVGKLAFYKNFDNIVEITYATMLVHNKRRFYLSHYLTETATLESNPKTCIINVHGHLHVRNMFYEDKPYHINVSVDVTGGKLLTLDDIEKAFNEKVKECVQYLV